MSEKQYFIYILTNVKGKSLPENSRTQPTFQRLGWVRLL
jgi:hypothetical protein